MSKLTLHHKIGLGTVQLGLAYGINNPAGKPAQQEAFAILNEAHRSGITLLDTADAYGDSLDVLGSYIRTHGQKSFVIVNKFIHTGTSLAEKMEAGLSRLGTTHLYGYMYHRFQDYRDGACREELQAYKKKKVVEKVGVSLYDLHELEQAVGDPFVDLIQLPVHPFDFSAGKKELLREAKRQGKEIHVRSVFFQGLFFKDPATLTGNLTVFREPLMELQEVARHHRLDIQTMCLNYALHNASIDKVIIGVDSAAQLQKNMASIVAQYPDTIAAALESIVITTPEVLNPSAWKP
ncbi:aldo/keto reductase [Parachryseolinea silvisoli]|uniref:aldo/keto reductase n=1 Tax=Parachryseolinea silvisoli TaxID=2873601 RepID=UPI00226596A0|nr:aldo/keto reductase [Parachryseolinea silvisoli]MCD9019621.1 aldo/keto reductase [Parachryseolinea silvisoli]